MMENAIHIAPKLLGTGFLTFSERGVVSTLQWSEADAHGGLWRGMRQWLRHVAVVWLVELFAHLFARACRRPSHQISRHPRTRRTG